MDVETYSERYFSDVVKLIENFHEEALKEYDEAIDYHAIVRTIQSADHGNSFLLIVDGSCQGILSGTCLVSPASGKQIFQEVIWYVNKAFRRYGVWLLREVEKILKSKGVSIIIMAVLENSKAEKLKSFYQRLGYKPMESHFVRTL